LGVPVLPSYGSVYGPGPNRGTLTCVSQDRCRYTLYDPMARHTSGPSSRADPKRVTMLCLRPTVYNYRHIGNFRPVVVFSMLFPPVAPSYGEGAVLYAAHVTTSTTESSQAAGKAFRSQRITTATRRPTTATRPPWGALMPTPRPGHRDHGLHRRDDQRAAGAQHSPMRRGQRGSSTHPAYRTTASLRPAAGRDESPAPGRGRPYKPHPADFGLWKPSSPARPEWPSPWGPGPAGLAPRVLGDDRFRSACPSHPAGASTTSSSRNTMRTMAQACGRPPRATPTTGCTTAS